jgi:class 3 adenylate cyclase
MNIAESGGGSVAHATSTSGVGDGDATQQQQTSGVLGEDDTSSLQAPKSTGIGEFGGAGAMIAEVLSKKRYAEFNMGYRVKQRAQAIDATEVIENSGSGDIYEDEGGFEVNATETPRSGGHGDPNRSSSFIAKSAILANVGGGALYSGVPGLEFQSLSVSGGAKTAFGRGGVAISGAVGGAAASGHRRMNALTTVDFRLTDIAMSQAFRELHMRDLRRESTMHICSGVVMMISSPLLCTVPSTSDWDYTPPPSNFNNNGNAAVHGNNQHGTPPASATDDVLSPNLPPAARRRGARRGVQEDATADRALEMSYHQEARDRSFAAIRSGDIDLTYDKAHRQGGGHLNQHAASPGRGAAGGNGDGEDGQEGGDDDREEGGLCAKGTCLYQFLNGTDDDAEEGVSQSQLGSMERFHLRTAEKLRNRAAAVSNATGSSNTNKNNGVGPTSAPVTTKRAENILLTTERDDWKTLETARMNKFIQVIEDSVNGSGGVIHSVAGDAIIAVWNVNNSSTKPVASASLAAFSIQRRVQALMSSQLFSSLMLPPATLPVTIALGTSYVIAGNVKLGNQGRVSMLLAGPGVVSCSNLLNASQQHRSPIVIDNASVNQLSSLTFADYDHCLRPIGISIPTSEVNRIRKLRREGSGFGVSRSTAFQSSTLDGLGLKRSGKADTNSGSTPAGNSHSDSLIELKGTAAAAPPTESFHKSKLSVDSSSLQHAFKEDSEVDVRSMYDYLEEHNYIVYSLYPARIMRSEKLRQWHATFREMVVLYVCREDYDGAIKVLQRYRVEHCGASPDERPTASGTIITGTTIPTPLVAPPGPSSPFSASLATKVDHTADVWLEKLLKGADQARIRGVLRDRAVRQQAAAAAAVAAANTTSGRKLKKSKSKHLKVESSDQNALS